MAEPCHGHDYLLADHVFEVGWRLKAKSASSVFPIQAEARLGQPIVIENIGGAGGTTGSTRAMRTNPDGYTIEMGQTGTHAIAVTLYPNLAYKPDIDFAPIGLVSVNPVMIVARKDLPPRDFKEFVPM